MFWSVGGKVEQAIHAQRNKNQQTRCVISEVSPLSFPHATTPTFQEALRLTNIQTVFSQLFCSDEKLTGDTPPPLG
jgi:hypothetical protein